MPTATTEVVNLGEGVKLVQNLGPDLLYIEDNPNVTAETGVQVTAGDSVSAGSGETHYCVSAGTSDYRLLGEGTGYHLGTPPS
jgi:hypothetical protein